MLKHHECAMLLRFKRRRKRDDDMDGSEKETVSLICREVGRQVCVGACDSNACVVNPDHDMALAALRACTWKSEVVFLDRRVLVYDLVDRIEILVEDLVHSEHVYAVLLEDCAHSIVAPNLALVARVLEFARLDIFPYLLYRLRSGELGFAEQFGEGWREGHRFLVKVSCCWTARQ